MRQAETPLPSQNIQSLADFVFTTEKDRSVILFEGEQAGIGWAATIPAEAASGVESCCLEPAGEPSKALLSSDCKVDDLYPLERSWDLAIGHL